MSLSEMLSATGLSKDLVCLYQVSSERLAVTFESCWLLWAHAPNSRMGQEMLWGKTRGFLAVFFSQLSTCSFRKECSNFESEGDCRSSCVQLMPRDPLPSWGWCGVLVAVCWITLPKQPTGSCRGKLLYSRATVLCIGTSSLACFEVFCDLLWLVWNRFGWLRRLDMLEKQSSDLLD